MIDLPSHHCPPWIIVRPSDVLSTLRPASQKIFMPKTPPSRFEFIALISLITSLTAVSIDAMLPALRVIATDLNVAEANNIQLIVSLFILGMVFGELIFGPLSDAIGRKRAILAGLAVYAAGTLLAMTATSLEQILIGRIIQGIGVSGPKIASRALVRDQFEGAAMARIMSFIFMVFILVPMLAPAAGQFILQIAGWRAIFLLYLGFGLVIALWLGFRQPETLAPSDRVKLSLPVLVHNASLILRHRHVMAYTLAAGFVFGGQLLYLGTAQAMFYDLYGIDDDFPLYFAFLAFGIGLAAFSNSQLVLRVGMFRLAAIALASMAILGGILGVTGLLYDGVPPLSMFLGTCFGLFCCVGLLFGNLNAMAMQSLGRIAGLGASMISSISSLLAVILAVAIGHTYDKTILPLSLGFTMAGLVALALILAVNKSPAKEI